MLRLGISLNPGFADRVTIYGNVVYDAPGNYSLRVPLPGGKHKKKLGTTLHPNPNPSPNPNPNQVGALAVSRGCAAVRVGLVASSRNAPLVAFLERSAV